VAINRRRKVLDPATLAQASTYAAKLPDARFAEIEKLIGKLEERAGGGAGKKQN